MTDKELLELAAKAAGYEVLAYDSYTDELTCKSPDRGTFIWAPRKDDGDALRLAVKLMLYIFIDEENNRTHVEGRINGDYEMFTGPHNDDPYAATRRAIVRAAAEIGAQMK